MASLAALRDELQRKLEAQRGCSVGKGKQREKTPAEGEQHEDSRTDDDVKSEEALQAAFRVLLLPDGAASRSYSHDETAIIAAFDVVTLLAQLRSVRLSQSAQEQLARVVYEYWGSNVSGIHCRTLLDTLLVRPSPDKNALLPSLLRIVANSPFTSKRPLQILSHCLDHVSIQALDASMPDLWTRLTGCLRAVTGAQPAAKVMAKYVQKDLIKRPPELIHLLLPLIRHQSEEEEGSNARSLALEFLVPPIIQQSPDLLLPLLSQLSPMTNDTDLATYLSLARIGATYGCLTTNEDDLYSLIRTSVTHLDPAIRFEALRLLNALSGSKTLSRPIPSRHFEPLFDFWFDNLGDTDSAAVRTALIGYFKEFCLRCRQSAYAADRDIIKYTTQLAKATTKDQDKLKSQLQEAERYVWEVQRFFKTFAQWAVENLDVMKPYRCQSNALRYLEILLNEGLDPDFLPSAALRSQATPSRSSPVTAATSKKKTPPPGASWPFSLRIVKSRSFVQHLVVCVTSTYEDIKQTAFTILRRCPLPPHIISEMHEPAMKLVAGKRDAEVTSGVLLLRLLCDAEATKQSQANSTDVLFSMAETYDSQDQIMSWERGAISYILHQLPLYQHHVLQASQDFARTAVNKPIHGSLAAINALLKDHPPSKRNLAVWSQIYRESVQFVLQVWEITKPFLTRSSESGEGSHNLDDDGEEVPGGDGTLLSAAWRAMKEAGDLLSTLLSLPVTSAVPIWSTQEICQHGSWFGIWLLEVEHRGAYAHISNAYGRLCTLLARSRTEAADLPRQWLESHLDETLLRNRPTKRRSAGIPYLLLGVLSGSNQHSPNLQYAFSRLFAALLSDSEASDATKSHAVNSLRVLFLDGKMSPAVQPFLEQAFIAAIEGFGSLSWAVRNASLLLYAALIQRVFGTKREHLPIDKRPLLTDFFKQHATLHTLVLAELRRHLDTGPTASEEALGSVFSALLLLSLLAVPDNSPAAAEELAAPFLPFIERYSASPVWKIREAAAAALTGITPPYRTWSEAMSILHHIRPSIPENEMHGKCLQILHLVKTSSITAPPPFWKEACDVLSLILLETTRSLPVRTSALHIALLTSAQHWPESFKQQIQTFGQGELNASHLGRPGEASWQEALAQALICSDPGWIVPCLNSNHMAQGEALSILSTSRGSAATSAPVVNGLANVIKSFAYSTSASSAAAAGKLIPTTYENAMLAVTVLTSSKEPLDLGRRNGEIIDCYPKTTVIPFKEALLPLVCRIRASETTGFGFMKAGLLEEIRSQSLSESVVARIAACRALAYYISAKNRDPIGADEALLLFGFLQDEDMAIRRMASTMWSACEDPKKPSMQSQAVLGQVAVKLYKCNNLRLMKEVYMRMLSELEGLLEDFSDQDGVLFAVEKSNVFVDVMYEDSIYKIIIADIVRRLTSGEKSDFKEFREKSAHRLLAACKILAGILGWTKDLHLTTDLENRFPAPPVLGPLSNYACAAAAHKIQILGSLRSRGSEPQPPYIGFILALSRILSTEKKHAVEVRDRDGRTLPIKDYDGFESDELDGDELDGDELDSDSSNLLATSDDSSL